MSDLLLLQLANNIPKFVRQRLCGRMELDQLTGLQMHIGGFQIVLDRLTQLIGCTDSFTRYDRNNASRVFTCDSRFCILIGRPRRIPYSVHCISEVGKESSYEL
jgi:hypothetical protein